MTPPKHRRRRLPGDTYPQAFLRAGPTCPSGKKGSDRQCVTQVSHIGLQTRPIVSRKLRRPHREIKLRISPSLTPIVAARNHPPSHPCGVYLFRQQHAPLCHRNNTRKPQRHTPPALDCCGASAASLSDERLRRAAVPHSPSPVCSSVPAGNQAWCLGLGSRKLNPTRSRKVDAIYGNHQPSFAACA